MTGISESKLENRLNIQNFLPILTFLQVIEGLFYQEIQILIEILKIYSIESNSRNFGTLTETKQLLFHGFCNL